MALQAHLPASTGRKASLRPHRRIAAWATGRRNHWHGAALRCRRVHFRIDTGRWAQHSIRFRELVPEGLGPAGCSAARGNSASLRYSFGRRAVRCCAVGILRRGRRGRRRRCRRSLRKRNGRKQRQRAAGGNREFHFHQRETASARGCSGFIASINGAHAVMSEPRRAWVLEGAPSGD